jgi:hypothetical protein
LVEAQEAVGFLKACSGAYQWLADRHSTEKRVPSGLTEASQIRMLPDNSRLVSSQSDAEMHGAFDTHSEEASAPVIGTHEITSPHRNSGTSFANLCTSRGGTGLSRLSLRGAILVNTDITEETAMPETAVMPVANPNAELPRRPASLGTRVVTIIAIVGPLAGVVAAPFYVWGWGFRWTDLALFVGMYVLSAFGITIGFHRLFVHRSFETYMWIKVIFAILGSMALQGPLLKWVGMHRWHHQHSDTPDDPHSPQHGDRRRSSRPFLGCFASF